jgi:hypothetical protein
VQAQAAARVLSQPMCDSPVLTLSGLRCAGLSAREGVTALTSAIEGVTRPLSTLTSAIEGAKVTRPPFRLHCGVAALRAARVR